MLRPCFQLSAALLITVSVFGAESDPLYYSRDIRPILSANCFACHGADEQSRKAKLRLDTFQGATFKKEDTQAVVPGHPEQSELIRRVTTSDSDDVMPPPKTGKKLSSAQINTIKRWITEGAFYTKHWSFGELKRPSLPAVKNKYWCRNPIDNFILSRLEKERLKPEAEADRRTLIRRLSLDLIGLPPTPEEVNKFLADKSPVAFEHLVDRLLTSETFGEHWARMWLDLARYADTKGYEKDQPRTMWRYRDWVIDAYNADMPYDEFTREQLAGDLLPSATENQILATTFHRNTMTNEEGGTDDEEFRVLAVKDRIDTTAQVWMGLTMGCAKCHSHKYDPITQTEYYRFYALFNETEDADRGDEFPTVPMPTEEQKQKKTELESRLSELTVGFAQFIPDLRGRQVAWEHTVATPSPWSPLLFSSGSGIGGSELSADGENIITVSGPYPETETNIVNFTTPAGPVTALKLEVLQKDGSKGPGRSEHDRNVVVSKFALSFEAASGQKEAVNLKTARADFSQTGWEAQKAIDGDDGTGWAFSPQQDRPHVIVFELESPKDFIGDILSCTIVQKYPKLQLERFRLSFATNPPANLKPEFISLEELASLPESDRSQADKKRLEEAYRKQHEPTATIDKEITATKKQLKDLDESVAKTPIMRELPPEKRRVTHVHRRGNFLDPGDEVTPGLPEAFGTFPPGASTNRLGVAEWLVSTNNSLTPRVAVNRAWARIFGNGLVETEEDFGAQGSAPTHPELLDWLAVEFRDTAQWSWKQLLKTIVMSAAYRQSSHQDTLKLTKDPRNFLLSRAPRFRLAAETIRDQALAVSGLLSPKMHGPSVMPPQPEGIWRAVYSGLKWETSPGEDGHRRALYTFWRRTSPYPSMTTFDAGSGEVCTVRRIRTNTPLQALVTLNDPAFVEAAGALARRMCLRSKHEIDEGFELVLARPPRNAERSRLMKLYESTQHEFTAHPDAAKELLNDAQVSPSSADDAPALAAWTTVANVLLNLDETLTRP